MSGGPNANDSPGAPGFNGRNLIVCLDGTDNQFGPINTNVVRLAQVLNRDPDRQRLYYDPGVGTMAEPGAVGTVKKWCSIVAGLAFGAGVDWKAQEAYSFLMDFWERGDRVYIFGFSRGAYTARVLAGMLYTVGLLPRGSYNLVPYAMRLYREIRKKRKTDESSDWEKVCEEFRWSLARPIDDSDQERHFPVHFLGAWDTVSSVGYFWSPDRYPYTARNPGVGIARHAISVDERRWFFRSNQFRRVEPSSPNPEARAVAQDLLEIWFPGVHCDVGGGYPEKLGEEHAELWREPFLWMLGEAERAGLLIDPIRLPRVLGNEPEDPRPWADAAHESLTKWWWPAEFVPKPVWNSKRQAQQWEIGLGRHRIVPHGSLLHRTVLRRIRNNALRYAPPNLSAAFLAKVRSLEVVPDTMAYED